MAGEGLIPVVVPAAASVGGALGMFVHGMMSPSSRLMGPIVVHGVRDSGKVALTFDDGPNEGTERVLDALRVARCRATFFFIGRNVRAKPGLVKRAAEEGHLIGNHSFDHARQGIWRRRWYWINQLDDTDRAIRESGGPESCEFFRPPMGFKSWRMVAAASRTRHRMVTWSLRGMDGVPTTSEAILARVLPRAAGGDIIALHDGAEPGKMRDPTSTIEAIPELVRGLRAKGLEPVRLDELLGGAIGARSGGRGAGTTTPAAARAT